MSSFRLRPRFSHVLEMDMEAARELIVNHARGHPERCAVKSFPGYVALFVVEKDTHYWSPRLSLSLESACEGKTRIDGTYPAGAGGVSKAVWPDTGEREGGVAPGAGCYHVCKAHLK